MSNLPRKAPATIRRQIVEALQDPSRRFLDPNSSSRNYLDHWDLKAAGFFADLADGLASDLLFLKPKNHPDDPQRYQCVLAYPEDDPYQALDIHVTLSPKGDPPRVMVAVHVSDSVQTLPRINLDP
jgi:hypothetical protein